MQFSLRIAFVFVYLFIVMQLVSFCDNVALPMRNDNTACTYTKDIPLGHFWKSTGLSPPDSNNAYKYLLEPDEKFNLILIGALPHHGIRQVRIHWLLNLITYEESEKSYNFTNLDILLDLMQANNLRPGFELMGLPLNIKLEVIKKNIYNFWYELTEAISTRYISRYGYDEVQKWRFETMNEPDLKQYNFLNFTLQEYLEYFKACTHALHNVSVIYTSVTTKSDEKLRVVNAHDENELIPSLLEQAREATVTTSNAHVESRPRRKKVSSLRVGGPAGLFKRRERHPLCWGALDMCNRTACHLHYVSFHKKGGGSADQVLSEDLDMLDVLQKYDFTKGLPIANDEADILTNWSLNEEWRADVWYAALMSKVIVDHYKEIILKRNISIEVLSNDNAFMNYSPYYFTQRTLLARFQMNNTTPAHVQFIKKPVYIAMGLLSMLGDEFLPTDNYKIIDNDNLISYKLSDSNISVLYTKRTSKYSNVLTVLIVAVNDKAINNLKLKNKNIKAKNITLKVDVNNLLLKCNKFAKNKNVHDPSSYMITYALDNDQTNPYQIWKDHKSPDFPDKTLRNLLRKHEGPVREKVEYKTLKWNKNLQKLHSLKLNLSVKIPSIHLINICVDSTLNALPGEVVDLRGYYVTNNEVLLTWSDKKVRSRCVKTYEVEYQASENNTFERINTEDLILLSYQHDESNYSSDFGKKIEKMKNSMVFYRVRAVDYWDRPGTYSNIINSSNIIHL